VNDIDDDFHDDLEWEKEPTEEDAARQDEILLRRQRHFRAAAERVAVVWGEIAAVEKIVLFGAAAARLWREIPRFRAYQRARIVLWHECRDVDLAVWVSDLGCLADLRKAVGRALRYLLAEKGIGIAHHQVDAFIMEPGSDRHLGALCHFNECPKGKSECLVAGCGTPPFLRQHEGFALAAEVAQPDRYPVLYERRADRDA